MDVLGCILMAVVTLPISFFLARGCLRSLLKMVTGDPRRDVL
jgi:hypothetical protein